MYGTKKLVVASGQILVVSSVGIIIVLWVISGHDDSYRSVPFLVRGRETCRSHRSDDGRRRARRNAERWVAGTVVAAVFDPTWALWCFPTMIAPVCQSEGFLLRVLQRNEGIWRRRRRG
ncbi:hypothetical protein B0H11DRAFT_569230 [Mycena galericulata]|nr:hypothetical protein B0H11DRAFT_569230 [Mycena galericulata]